MNQAHILLVEDEPHIASGLIYNLEAEGYQVTHVERGEAVTDKLWQETFALVVLDITLPGIDGLEVCRQVRKQDPKLPVLMLTARSEDKDRIEGLSAGADDYLTKPFNLDEFLLRVSGMLRRSAWYRPEAAPERHFSFGDNEVNLHDGVAQTIHGEITLTEHEVKLLRTFFRREDEIISRSALLEAVWGMAPETETRTLDNFIVRLRKYFEEDPSAPIYFQTIRGRGYRFVRAELKKKESAQNPD